MAGEEGDDRRRHYPAWGGERIERPARRLGQVAALVDADRSRDREPQVEVSDRAGLDDRRAGRGGTMRHHGGEDRRVRQTKELLRDALASLVHEKSYDDIAVNEILAAPHVGRSTFYAHFRFMGEPLKAALNSGCDMPNRSRASVRVPWHLMLRAGRMANPPATVSQT